MHSDRVEAVAAQLEKMCRPGQLLDKDGEHASGRAHSRAAPPFFGEALHFLNLSRCSPGQVLHGDRGFRAFPTVRVFAENEEVIICAAGVTHHVLRPSGNPRSFRYDSYASCCG